MLPTWQISSGGSAESSRWIVYSEVRGWCLQLSRDHRRADARPVLAMACPSVAPVRRATAQSRVAATSCVLYEHDNVGGEVSGALGRIVAPVPARHPAAEEAEVSDEMRLVVVARVGCDFSERNPGVGHELTQRVWNRRTRPTVFGGNPSLRANSRSTWRCETAATSARSSRWRGRRPTASTEGDVKACLRVVRHPSRPRKKSSSSAAPASRPESARRSASRSSTRRRIAIGRGRLPAPRRERLRANGASPPRRKRTPAIRTIPC